jgi:hypothetical protein
MDTSARRATAGLTGSGEGTASTNIRTPFAYSGVPTRNW